MRYAPELPLPAEPYRPGSGQPRPRLPLALPATPVARTLAHPDELASAELTAFRYGVDLFNAGCWWEAHEAWELVWQRCRRTSALGKLLQGLILLAAAQLKGSQRRAAARRELATRALQRLRAGAAVRPASPPLGLGLGPLLDACAALQRPQPPPSPSPTIHLDA